MTHPSIAPVEIQEGPKEGYFTVNLGKKSTFEEPEFNFSTGYKPQQQNTEDVDNFSETDEDSQHEDDEELQESPSSKKKNKNTNTRKQGELDNEDEFNAIFSELKNAQRFNDLTDTENDTDMEDIRRPNLRKKKGGQGLYKDTNRNDEEDEDGDEDEDENKGENKSRINNGDKNENQDRNENEDGGEDENEDEDDTDTVKNHNDSETDDEWGTKAYMRLEKQIEEVFEEHKKIMADDYDPAEEKILRTDVNESSAQNSDNTDHVWPFDPNSKLYSRTMILPYNAMSFKATTMHNIHYQTYQPPQNEFWYKSARKRSRGYSMQSESNSSFQSEDTYNSLASFIDDSSLTKEDASLCSSRRTSISHISQETNSTSSTSTSKKLAVEKRQRGRPRKNPSGVKADTTPTVKRKPGRPKKNPGVNDSQDQFKTLDSYFSKLSVSRPYCKPSTSASNTSKKT
ncbi:hypothetical protein [Parasitella parasitica]|uniref:Uncharacterized protein n=1 Tax=Parasitella parasitica TaxID=35722 RepID=A0A0B7MWE8_9FUNG|nr:hypothetical protein [Parasitella parasitica]